LSFQKIKINHVAHQNPDESEAVDECSGGAHEEGGKAIRDRLLQEQSSLLAVRAPSPTYSNHLKKVYYRRQSKKIQYCGSGYLF
jgi:hypothetical protein